MSTIILSKNVEATVFHPCHHYIMIWSTRNQLVLAKWQSPSCGPCRFRIFPLPFYRLRNQRGEEFPVNFWLLFCSFPFSSGLVRCQHPSVHMHIFLVLE